MLEEQWLGLDLLPTYEISNYGRVVNVNTGKEVVPQKDKDGYLRVTLYRKGKPFRIYLHRLVAKCFFLNYKDDRPVYHKNGSLLDCSVLNLTLTKPERMTEWDSLNALTQNTNLKLNE